ncbi:retrovirus-related Pol polyprotein from transposon TNT 1-94 [Trichonephila clavipes]|nr:retrovirus-related Pol polyprotein from transposon TNT 1-94 [Trichonephila clavipes]
MGKTKKLLGIEFEEIGNSLFIHQRSYIRRLCEIYEKYKYPVSSLPISKGQVLSKLDSPKTSEEILTVPYRNLIGSLSFIAIRTRPDIMYAVNVLSQFQANPGIKHWNCLLRLLGYLKYTQEYKLELSKVKSLKLRCYSDSDFATNRDDRVSMGGFITFIDETPISWRTFKQKSVSLSTMEADLELFFMNSVASTLNRVTDMEFNNQISVLTQNNWNTWKHDMQVLLMHYGCWQFIIQTKPEQPDEEATYKEKLDLQLRKDRCYTLIYTNISSDLKNLITETTDGVAAWKILKDHFEPVTRARIIQLLDQFFGTKYQPGEDVGIFISRVKTAATRLQEAGHKLDDLYIGFQLIRWLPQEFQSTVQQIYRWKEEDFRVVKIEAELILEANRLQLMKQDLEKAENAYLSSFTSKKSKTLPGATAAAHGDPNGKNDYQKKGDLKPITNMKMSLATEDKSCPVEGIGTLRFRKYGINAFCHVNNDYLVKTSKNDSVKGLPRLTDNGKTHCIPCKLAKSKRVSFKKTGAVRSKRPLELLHMDLCGPMPTESQGGNKYFLSIIDDYSRKVTVFPIRNKSDVFHTFIRFQKRAERFLSKKVIAVRTDGGLEFCNKDMDNFLTELGIKHEVTNSYTPEMNGVAERFNLTALDGIKTLLKSSEVPHKFWGEALLCFTYAWNRICHKDSNKTPFEKYSGRKPSVLHLKPFGCLAYAEGEATRLKSFNEIERYCKRHNIEYDPSLFNFRKDNTESQGFSDLSEQQEALMVEVTIPNCYKQAIRSRDASKWHDAMDKEINVMMERKVWDLVDHPDNIKILENRWVYTIKYDENNKIVRYKARLVARGNTQLRGESFDEVFSPVINFTIVRLFFTICVCLWKWTHIQVDITNAYLYANLDTVIYMKQPTGYEIDNNKVCKLRKAIYGLHQSGRQWFLELENKLIKLKFKKLEWVNCVYMFEDNVILLFYVDDMIIFGKEMENVNFVLQLLQKNFDLKIMGKTKKLLGIEFEEIGNSLFIHQRSYIRRLCEIYEKYKYPVSSLPISKGQVLSKLDSPKTSEEILTVPYRNLIGSLSFIAIRTRPDIMYAVNVLSQFQANPGIKHWNCLLRLLGYLKYTQEYKLELSKVKSLKLRCYSDSDFATNRDDRVSMGGFITFIDETPISWRTFKQKSVSLSTMEAEYVSLTEAAKEFIWLKNVIDNKSLNLELSENVMFCDNQAAISFSKSPVENYRTKHIDVRYHFLRNLIYDKVFQIKYIGTKNNLADIFTKPMVKEKLLEFCRKLFLFRE